MHLLLLHARVELPLRQKNLKRMACVSFRARGRRVQFAIRKVRRANGLGGLRCLELVFSQTLQICESKRKQIQHARCASMGVRAAIPNDPGRTRTCNLWFRRPTPYPLGHRANAYAADLGQEGSAWQPSNLKSAKLAEASIADDSDFGCHARRGL